MTNKLVKMDFCVMTSSANLHVQSFFFLLVLFLFSHICIRRIFWHKKRIGVF